jgi:uncharacterized protein
MKISITRKQEQITTTWSGGTTTQLAIYPPDSILKGKNFLFRISTAVVEAETSVFTALPGVIRVIMVLEGTLELVHTGHYSKTLQQFETDTFSGDWKTTSQGKVTDFNLMTTGKARGKIEREFTDKHQPVKILFQDERTVAGIYVLKGSLNYQSGSTTGILGPADFLLAFPEMEKELLVLLSDHECEFIRVLIDTD